MSLVIKHLDSKKERELGTIGLKTGLFQALLNEDTAKVVNSGYVAFVIQVAIAFMKFALLAIALIAA